LRRLRPNRASGGSTPGAFFPRFVFFPCPNGQSSRYTANTLFASHNRSPHRLPLLEPR